MNFEAPMKTKYQTPITEIEFFETLILLTNEDDVRSSSDKSWLEILY